MTEDRSTFGGPRLDRRIAPPEKPAERTRIASVMYVARKMDQGNAMNRHKWVEDWLTQRGFIAGDDPVHLEWAGFPEQRLGDEPLIELTLSPLSAGGER